MCSSKEAITFDYGNSLSIEPTADNAKEKKIVPLMQNEEHSRCQDRHHLQTSAITDEDQMNIYIFIVSRLFKVQKFSNRQ